MVPMFVRSRPSPTRFTISPSWSRSASTTKSIARLFAGWPTTGPTTDTRVPPGLIKAEELFWMSPPMTSKTRSTSPTSCSCVVLEVDELLRAELERPLSVGGASGTDDVGAGLGRELGHHRSDSADRAMREDALPRLEPAVDEQSLPCGQPGDRQGSADREVDIVRQGREVACLDRDVLRQGAVAMPVREAEHALSQRQPRRAVAECGDRSRQLVPGDRWRPVTVGAIGPGRRPLELGRDPSRRVNLDDDVVDRCRRLGPLHQGHPGCSRSRSVTTIAFICDTCPLRQSRPDRPGSVTSTVCNLMSYGKGL